MKTLRNWFLFNNYGVSIISATVGSGLAEPGEGILE